MTPKAPGVYVDGVRVKGICGEESPWGMGGYWDGEEAAYGIPPANIRAGAFSPDFECCTPAQLKRWFDALQVESAREQELRGELLACAVTALKFVEEDEFGNPVDESCCSPAYARHLRGLKAAIAKANAFR